MTRPGALHRPRPFVYQEAAVPQMRFTTDAWGHKAGEVVEYAPDFARCLTQEGVAVEVDATPPVERAVAPEPQKETAQLKR